MRLVHFLVMGHQGGFRLALKALAGAEGKAERSFAVAQSGANTPLLQAGPHPPEISGDRPAVAAARRACCLGVPRFSVGWRILQEPPNGSEATVRGPLCPTPRKKPTSQAVNWANMKLSTPSVVPAGHLVSHPDYVVRGVRAGNGPLEGFSMSAHEMCFTLGSYTDSADPPRRSPRSQL